MITNKEMQRLNRSLVILTTTLCLFFANLVHAGCEDYLNEILAGNNCTKIRTYKIAAHTDKPFLIFVLRGDAPFSTNIA